MRRDVLDLRAFYGSPLGAAARTMVARKLAEAWGDAHGLDVLGLGYATPYLEAFREKARRAVAAMPGAQGVEMWPAGAPNLTCLTLETQLPFANALFDRVLAIHALEEADDPAAYLAEVRRVMAPSGRVIVAVAARHGLWTHADATPFGYGRAFTRSQLEEAVRAAGLEPAAWSRALYLPPLALFAAHAEALEQVGSRLWAPMSGLILLEAVKQTYAVKPRGLRVPAALPAGLNPAPAGLARAAPVSAESALGGKSKIRHTAKRQAVRSIA